MSPVIDSGSGDKSHFRTSIVIYGDRSDLVCGSGRRG